MPGNKVDNSDISEVNIGDNIRKEIDNNINTGANNKSTFEKAFHDYSWTTDQGLETGTSLEKGANTDSKHKGNKIDTIA